MAHRAYRDFAAYNEWANCRLYDAASALDDAAYRADHGAFCGSVHATLNHLLVTDRIWIDRFDSLDCAQPALTAILFEDFSSLRMARVAEDSRLRGFIKALSADDLARDISYANSSGARFTHSLASALDHLFNHQTHHRGQIHCLLTRIGGPAAAPSLDMILFQRERMARAGETAAG
ncbi:MAG: damage-inducible protein DinB [Rhizobiales bacterium 32-66-8]|nr:MAG: damage-inducible protein DinB [Rhizobiales bacterium 32-66-8]